MRAWPAAAALLLGGAAAATSIRAYDFFWHLAAGRRIVETGAVPRSDPFSFTAAGVHWVDHEWLYQVVIWGIWSALGPLGAWLWKIGLGIGIALVLRRFLRRAGVPVFGQVLLLAACLAGAAPRLTDRPEMVSLLFAPLVASWVCVEHAGRRRFMPLLVLPLAAVWSNIHPGAILAPLLVGAALAGVALEAALVPRRRSIAAPRLRILALAFLGSVAALMLNPYGTALLAVPFQLTGIVGQEWAPNREWLRPSFTDAPLVYLAVAGLALAAMLRWRRVSLPGLMIGLLGAALALRYVRNQGVLFVLLPFALAPLLARDDVLARVRPLASAALASVALLGFIMAPPQGRFGPGLEPGRFPEEAADFLESQGIQERMFHEDEYGGYLMWRFPGRPVFIDGRNEVYTELLPEIFAALREPPRFWELTRRHDLGAALVGYHRETVRYPTPDGGVVEERRSWSAIYLPRPEWALVHWDDTAMLWVRRSRFRPDWLQQHEVRWLHPDDWPRQRRALLEGDLDLRLLQGDLERRLQAVPDSRRARDLADQLQTIAENLTRRMQRAPRD